MEYFDIKELPKFENPEQELDFLRNHIAKREEVLRKEGVNLSPEQVANQTIEAYKNTDTSTVLHEGFVANENAEQGIVLRLHPESHDSNIEEFAGILVENGIKNALNVIAKLNNPHLDDDFHRFLVQYLIATHEIPGLKNGSEMERSLKLRLNCLNFP